LIEQRVLFLDHPRLKQQSTNLACCLNEINAACLSNHAGFVRCSQVTHDPRANVNALADVQGQSTLTFEDVNAKRTR
jgi:hypothetical protein